MLVWVLLVHALASDAADKADAAQQQAKEESAELQQLMGGDNSGENAEDEMVKRRSELMAAESLGQAPPQATSLEQTSSEDEDDLDQDTATGGTSVYDAARRANQQALSGAYTALAKFQSNFWASEASLPNNFNAKVQTQSTLINGMAKTIASGHATALSKYEQLKPKLNQLHDFTKKQLTPDWRLWTDTIGLTDKELVKKEKQFNTETRITSQNYNADYKMETDRQIKLTESLKKKTSVWSRKAAKNILALAKRTSKNLISADTTLVKTAFKNRPEIEGVIRDYDKHMFLQEKAVTEAQQVNEDLGERMEGLADSSNPASPGIEYAKERASQAFNDFDEHANNAVEDQGETNEERVEDLADAFAETRDIYDARATETADATELSLDGRTRSAYDAFNKLRLQLKRSQLSKVGSTKGLQRQVAPVENKLMSVEKQEMLLSALHEKELNGFTKNIENARSAVHKSLDENIRGGQDSLRSYLTLAENTLAGGRKNSLNALGMASTQMVSKTAMNYDEYYGRTMSKLSAKSLAVGKYQVINDRVDSTSKEQVGELTDFASIEIPTKNMGVAMRNLGDGIAADAAAAAMKSTEEFANLRTEYGGKVLAATQKGMEALSRTSEQTAEDIVTKSSATMSEGNDMEKKAMETTDDARKGMELALYNMGSMEENMRVTNKNLFDLNVDVVTKNESFQRGIKSSLADDAIIASELNTTLGATYKKGTDEIVDKADFVMVDLSGKIDKGYRNLKKPADEAQNTVKTVNADMAVSNDAQTKKKEEMRTQMFNLEGEYSKVNGRINTERMKLMNEISVTTRDVKKAAKNLEEARRTIKSDSKASAKDVTGAVEVLYDGQIKRYGEATSGALKNLGDKVEQISAASKAYQEHAQAKQDQSFEGAADIDVGLKNALNEIESHLGDTFMQKNLEKMDAANEGLIAVAKRLEDADEKRRQSGVNMKAGVKETIYLAEQDYIAQDKTVAQTGGLGIEALQRSADESAEKFRQHQNGVLDGALARLTSAQGSLRDVARDLSKEQRGMSMGAASEVNRLAYAAIQAKSATEKGRRGAEAMGIEAAAELARSRDALAKVAKDVESGSGKFDAQMSMMEKNNLAKVDALDTGKRQADGATKVQALEYTMNELRKATSEYTVDSNKIIDRQTSHIDDSIAGRSDEVAKLGKALGRAANKASNEIDPMDTAAYEDGQKAQDLLGDFHDLMSGFDDHVKNREARLKWVHSNTEKQITDMEAMKAYAGADAFENVKKLLAVGIEQDGGIVDRVDTTLKPQTQRWRDGIGNVFDELGLTLDMDKINANANSAAAEAAKANELGGTSGALEAKLRAKSAEHDKLMRKLKQRQQHMIDAVTRNDLVTELEKKKRIEQIKKESTAANKALYDKIVDTNSKILEDTVENRRKAGDMENMLTRARSAAVGPGRAPDSAEMAAQGAQLANEIEHARKSFAPVVVTVGGGSPRQPEKIPEPPPKVHEKETQEETAAEIAASGATSLAETRHHGAGEHFRQMAKGLHAADSHRSKLDAVLEAGLREVSLRRASP